MFRNDNGKVYAITFLHNGFRQMKWQKKYIYFFHIPAKVITRCPAGFCFLQLRGTDTAKVFIYRFLLLLFINQITTEKSTKLPPLVNTRVENYALKKND